MGNKVVLTKDDVTGEVLPVLPIGGQQHWAAQKEGVFKI